MGEWPLEREEDEDCCIVHSLLRDSEVGNIYVP